jgi:acetylornithine deacetylase/succinyl-diaminopimelate desuccinylase-like protein
MRLAALLAVMAASPRWLAAQQETDPRVAVALGILEKDNAWTLEQQASICEIPAPPFKETTRGAEFARRLTALGYRVTTDQIGNVIAVRPGQGGGRRLVLAAHLDTVFPEGTDVRVRREGTRLSGPGIGDDCRGLAVILAVARAVQLARVDTAGDLVFVGNVGEEGAGNLRGVRHLVEAKSAGQIDAFITVDGVGLGLVSRGVGSNRYRVVFKGPGGHSYGDFGIPNPIHAMGRAIALIGDLEVPTAPKTTFNVGMVEGGTSVNSIAGTATMQVDLRSESMAALGAVDSAFQSAIRTAVAAERTRWPASKATLEAEIQVIGKRATGSQPDSAWIVRTALAAASKLGIPAPTPGTASTDANVALWLGVPALALDGGGRGDGAHSLGEWYDDGDRGYLGTQWALLVAMAITNPR